METGSEEGESHRVMMIMNDVNGQSDGSRKTRRQMKTPYQLGMLEKTFLSEMYPSEATRAKLSVDLGLSDRQLQMWFCHRRLKDKKEVTVQRPVGENMEFIRAPQQQLMVVERGGGAGGSDNGSRSRSRHESLSRSRSRSVSGSDPGSESDSSEDNEPMRHSMAYELTQQNMMRRRIIECVEMQLGEALRKDGPELGIEFDELPPGAFGMPLATMKMHHSQNRHSYDENLYDQLPIKIEAGGRNIKHEPYGATSRSYGSPSGYTSDPRLLLQNGLQPPYATPRQLKGELGHLSSPINDNDYNLPSEEVMQMWRKRKSEEGVAGLDGHSGKRMKKELEKNHVLVKKREELIKKEMERQDRERQRQEERNIREKQKQVERYQREQAKAYERQEKFLQRESQKAERMRQKEDLRREREAIKQKASVEKAAAKKFAKESTELIEDERLELLEFAASSKGLTSIASLDYETLQTLDSFRDQLRVFPPKAVQVRLKRPFSVHPWIDSEENVGNLFMVWRFCMTFADILGLWPFTLDEFVQCLHDYDSRLLGEVHMALLKLIIRDIEDVARTPSGGPGTNQYTVANPEGGHPQIVEGAYKWGFDIRNWLQHLNPLTWPEVLRQFALSAGFGPQLKKDKVKRSSLPEMDEGKDCEDVIAMLRNGSAAENAAILMQDKGSSQPKKSRHRLTPGTVKFAAYHVLCLEGDKGLNVLDIAAKIQKTGLRDLTTSKTPDASISVALSRDPILFERVAPSTYCVRPPHRKDPATADEVIATAKERIQNFAMTGVLNVEDVEKGEDFETEVAEGQEIDLGTPSTVNEDVKTSVHQEGDVEMKTDSENAEIDEKKSGESWVQALTEGEYSDLCVEERLNALVALISVANEGNIIRLVLEDRLDAATAVRKQMWAEAQLDKRRLKEEFISKFQDSSPMPATEGGQSPLIPVTEGQDGHVVGQTVGQFNNNGYNTAERSRLQLKAFIGHKAEEMYVYRSLPLGQDRRRNRYWQFVASTSSHDPGSGRIFVELQSGGWRLIDSEEVFDALLPLLDTRGVRESHLLVMLQKIEAAFKESIRRNKRASDGKSTESSLTFNIELGETNLEKNNAMERYRDLEKWMWEECLYMPRLSAMRHGKQRSTPLQGICDFCHGSYCFEKKPICPRCYRSFSTLGDKLCYPESDIQDNVHNSNAQSDWDITHPIRIRLIKSLLALVEVSVPSEALQAFWTENIRNVWGSKLHGSLSPTDLLQVLTWFESVVRRDYLSLNFETTEELLKISGLSEKAALDSGSVPVLPWVPQTTAAVTLRLFQLDGLISYTAEQKAELDKENELKNAVVEKSPLKFTFLKNVGKTADTPGHVKPMKPPRGSGGRPRGSNGKWTKRTPGPVAVTENRQNVIIGDDFPMSQVMMPMSQVMTPQTHGTGPRTVRKRKPETMVVQEEPTRNFMHQTWINGPVHQMRPQNMNYHVDQEEEEEESESDDEQVRFENARYGESSGYGFANNESRWVETEISDDEGLEEDDGIMNQGYAEGNDRMDYNGEDSDSDDSGEYSD